jgi:hypothetical protein
MLSRSCVLLLLTTAALTACAETRPDSPLAPGGSQASHEPTGPFTEIVVTDPATVLVVDGVTTPRQVKVLGTLAGVVVTANNAEVDLSAATIDCSYRGDVPPGEKVGLWIQAKTTHARVTGRHTGVVRKCALQILIGPHPQVGGLGAAFNRVERLVVQDHDPFFDEEYADYGIVILNSHDNVVTIIDSDFGGGILVRGDHPASPVSGRNTVSHNSVRGVHDYGIRISADANVVSDNRVAGVFFNLVVDGNHNKITDNALTAELPDGTVSCGCYGVSLREGADDNLVEGNRTKVVEVGFLAEATTFRNVIRGNTALYYTHESLGGPGLSAQDMSGSCVNNTWVDNIFFEPKDPPCIQ